MRRNLGTRRAATVLAILVTLGLIGGGLWFRDWYPASPLDDRPTCAGMGKTFNNDCWGRPWP